MTEIASLRVVRATAAFADKDPRELPPLATVVDTDALDGLFADRLDGTPRPAGSVHLTYAGCDVTLAADGSVDVTSPDH